MGAVNIGDQRITWDFKQPAKAEEFNSALRDLVDGAFFKGGALSLEVSNTQLKIAPYTLAVPIDAQLPNFPNNKLIRVESMSDTYLEIGPSPDNIKLPSLPNQTAYVYCWMEWQDAYDVWLNFSAEDVTSGNLNPNVPRPTISGQPVVVIGTVTYNAAGNAFTAVSTAGRTYGFTREYLMNTLLPYIDARDNNIDLNAVLYSQYGRYLQQQADLGGL